VTILFKVFRLIVAHKVRDIYAIRDSQNIKRMNSSNNANNDITILSSEEIMTLGTETENLTILYITIIIIIGILLIWIIMVVVTKEDPVKVLNDMADLASQIKPVSDQLPIS